MNQTTNTILILLENNISILVECGDVKDTGPWYSRYRALSSLTCNKGSIKFTIKYL